MSLQGKYFQVPNAIFDHGLDSYGLAVLFYLLKFGKQCYPSHKRIAQKTNMSVTQVKKSLKALKAAGLAAWNPGYQSQPNTYHVSLKAIQTANTAPSEASSPTPVENDGCAFAGVPVAAPHKSISAPTHIMTDANDLLNDLQPNPHEEK